MLRIENLRREFVSHSATGKPFWITEVGWSTCTQAGMDCVSQAQQATNLTTLFDDAHGLWSNWLQAVFVYRYGDGAQPSTVQDAYGLTQLDGTPKPALTVFRSAVQAAGG
jgi:exo-beta-1,3-glucanase (GH17 family)